MGISRRDLKLNTKYVTKVSKPSIILSTLAYVVIIYVINLLCSYLSGYASTVNEAMEAIKNGMDFSVDDIMHAMSAASPTPVACLLVGLNMLVLAVVQAGYYGYSLLASRGQAVTVKDLFMGFSFILRVLGISILTYLIVAVGTILFVIPGIIASYSYRMALYVMFDNPKMGVVDCLRESRQMMRGRKFELFVLDLSFIGWRIAASIVSAVTGIPMLDVFLIPYFGITYAGFYDAINGRFVPQYIGGDRPKDTNI